MILHRMNIIISSILVLMLKRTVGYQNAILNADPKIISSGDSILLTCQYTGPGNVSAVSWLNGSNSDTLILTPGSIAPQCDVFLTINTSYDPFRISYTCDIAQNRYTLKIHPLRAADENVKWSCTFHDPLPCPKMAEYTIHLTGYQNAILNADPKIVSSGDSILLTCHYTGPGNVSAVSWLNGSNSDALILTSGSIAPQCDVFLTINTSYDPSRISYTCDVAQNRYTLKIHPLGAVDENVKWSCTFQDPLPCPKMAEYTIHLTGYQNAILCADPAIVSSGDSILLACQYTGPGNVSAVSWLNGSNSDTLILTPGSIAPQCDVFLTINTSYDPSRISYTCDVAQNRYTLKIHPLRDTDQNVKWSCTFHDPVPSHKMAEYTIHLTGKQLPQDDVPSLTLVVVIATVVPVISIIIIIIVICLVRKRPRIVYALVRRRRR